MRGVKTQNEFLHPFCAAFPPLPFHNRKNKKNVPTLILYFFCKSPRVYRHWLHNGDSAARMPAFALYIYCYRVLCILPYKAPRFALIMPCYAAFFFSILLDNGNRFRIRNKMPPERHFSLYWRIKSAFGMWYNSTMGWRHAAAARNLFIFTGR